MCKIRPYYVKSLGFLSKTPLFFGFTGPSNAGCRVDSTPHLLSNRWINCWLYLILHYFLLVYKDVNTQSPYVEDMSQYGDDGEAARASKPDHIYMDAMGFGMGCSCLQMTFQACSIEEARGLYDQLTPLCPIIVSTTAYLRSRCLILVGPCQQNLVGDSLTHRFVLISCCQ